MIERRVNIKQGGGYYINSLGYNNNNNEDGKSVVFSSFNYIKR